MENLQEFIYVNELLAIYGQLLTAKQQEIMKSYYEYNLSLLEIAENLSISKAAVSDALKVSLTHLYNLEKSVGQHAYKHRVKTLLTNIKGEDDLEKIKTLIAKEEEDNGI